MDTPKTQDIEILLKYHNNNKDKEALPIADRIVSLKINNHKIYDVCGEIFYKFKLYNKATFAFAKSININPNSFYAYNNLGLCEYFLGNFKKSLKIFNYAKKLDLNNSILYFNIARSFGDLGMYDNAIENYCKSIELDKNNQNSKINLIKSLTYYKPISSYNNQIVEINKKLNFLKIPINDNSVIIDDDIRVFFQKSLDLINIILPLEYNFLQIFRQNNKLLDCSKHHTTFQNYNIIPKFCFSCFKVQVDVNDIYDLIKLHFLFDNINSFSNIKKCMIEKRPNVKGNYKGFIYCSTEKEALKLKSIVSDSIKNKLNINFNINIKRGCSEFAEKFPNYKITNKDSESYFLYNEQWKEKEKIINEFFSKNNSKELVLKETLKGNSINDILIILQWIDYAKNNNDSSYKKLY